MNQSTCSSAQEALAKLQRFIDSQRQVAEEVVGAESLRREDRFFSIVHQALSQCEPKAVRDALEEMRGLSHYFGAYCWDTDELQGFIDDLYKELQKVIIKLRS